MTYSATITVTRRREQALADVRAALDLVRRNPDDCRAWLALQIANATAALYAAEQSSGPLGAVNTELSKKENHQ